MEVIIQKDAEATANLASLIIANQIITKPHSVLGMATGRTMEMLYKKLVDRHINEDLDFSLCHTFNLDEYVGIDRYDENSYRSYMNKHLFEKVNIDFRNTHVPHGDAEDLDQECRDYDERIANRGGIDLQLLGIGQDGHIGFNEPLSALKSRTRAKALAPETIEQNRHLFSNPNAIPRRAITMGVGTILESKRALLIATGKEKAAIIHKAVEGPITSMVTASALQLHSYCTVIVDEDAASELEGKEHYRWVFENEPEWDQYR